MFTDLNFFLLNFIIFSKLQLHSNKNHTETTRTQQRKAPLTKTTQQRKPHNAQQAKQQQQQNTQERKLLKPT